MRLSPVVMLCCFLAAAVPSPSGEAATATLHNTPTTRRPFASGEELKYRVSWSSIFSAGEAAMVVTRETTPEGAPVYRFTSNARSTGIVNSIYPVRDTVRSVVDAGDLSSRWYELEQKRRKRRRHKEFLFDQAANTVQVVRDGRSETFSVPSRVADPLSSLYYLRTRDDLVVGATILIDVHDSGKNWAVDVQVLEKEQIKTPVGTFNTIKVKTNPKYEGVFQNKGEIIVWLTDDDRRLPVLMKSSISVGTIVSTLVGYTPGAEEQP